MSDTTSGGHGSGTDRLKQTAEEARDAARERMDDAKEQTRAAAEQAQKRAVEEAERGKKQGAGEVRRWSDALDRAADELGKDSTQGSLMRQASEGLDDIARSIENRSVGEMTEAVADFGRRNPTAFLGSAMLAGFALARFATASQPRPQPDHGGDYDYGGDSRSTGMGNSGIAGRRPEQQSNLTSPAVGSQVGPAAASGPAGTATKNHETSTGQTGHAGGSTPGGLSPTDRRGNDPLELTDGMRRDEDDDANGPAHGARPVPGAATDRKETDR